MKKYYLSVLFLILFLTIATPSFAQTSVSQYGVFEDTYTYSTSGLANPWENVTVTATVHAPSGKIHTFKGFYYDVNTYKLRFMPVEAGNYSYNVVITGPSGTQTPSGSFTATASNYEGIIRERPGTYNQLMFDDGSSFYGIGFNDCIGTPKDANGNVIYAPLTHSIGDPNYEPPGEGGDVSMDEYFRKYYEEGGFNLFRWNPGNCSFGINGNITTSGNTYKVIEGQLGDQLLSSARNHGYHIMYTFFLLNPKFPNATPGSPEAQALERAMDYAMARYGSYVDIWEIWNEAGDEPISPTPIASWEATDEWVAMLADYVRSVEQNDQYGRIVTNSHDRRTDAAYLDIRSPHRYHQMGSFHDKINPLSIGLPGIMGEAGRAPGGGGAVSYNTQEIMKTRVANWTSYFDGAGLIYWNTPFKVDCCNTYLGGTERKENKILYDFAQQVDPGMQPGVLPVSGQNYAYSITSPNFFGIYIYNNQYDTTNAQTYSRTVTLPFAGTGEWIDTRTGSVVQSSQYAAGSQTITAPSFVEDIAFKLISQNPVPTYTPYPTSTIGPSPTPTPTPGLSSSLVAYWNLDEGSGNSSADKSGNNQTLTLFNNPTWVPGMYGQAVSFDGVDDYAEVVGFVPVQYNSYTVSFYVKAGGVAQPANATLFNNFNNPPGSSDDSIQIDTDGGSPGVYRSYFSTHKVPIGIVDTAWHHVAVTYDGDVVYAYFDGVRNNGQSSSPGFAGTNFRNIIFGKNRAGSNFFNGSIDEVKIYNRALSQAEIQSIMSPPATKPGDVDGDGDVDITDLATLLSTFGGSNPAADFNSSGTVDIADLATLLSNFGT